MLLNLFYLYFIIFSVFPLTFACYSVINKSSKEIHFKHQDHHFLTILKESSNSNEKILAIRPRPGNDINGWGSTLYLQPFLPGSLLSHTKNIVSNQNTNDINITAEGQVSKGTSSTYGNWTLQMKFIYNENTKNITGTGQYSIVLDRGLNSTTGDLNLFKIASNYLKNVPLLTGATGDTGDMGKNVTIRGTGSGYPTNWSPAQNSTIFIVSSPSKFMSIEVPGEYNNVDTKAQGYGRIEPAYKPSIEIESNCSEYLVFGGIYDTSKNNFWEDNIGITPLFLKTVSSTSFSCQINFESQALSGDPAKSNSSILLKIIRRNLIILIIMIIIF